MPERDVRRAIEILGCVVIAAVAAQPSRPSVALLDEIRSHRKGTAVWWVGNAGWLIKSGDLLIGTDLDLSTEEKIQAPPITAIDLASEIDIAFVSHHHGDHCNIPTIRTLAQRGECIFVLPRPCLKEVSSLAIPADRIIVPEPLQPFDVKGIHVEPIHAIHGNQDFTVSRASRILSTRLLTIADTS